jgi:peroxiredoxin
MLHRAKGVFAALTLLVLPFVAFAHETGEKHHDLTPAPEPQAETSARVAPDFTLTDQNGKSVTLSELKGKIVVLEWTNPDCPYVKKHYDDYPTMVSTYNKHKGEDVVWLSINSSHYNTPEASKAFAEAHGLEYSILQDANGNVGRLYGAKTTPHMFVIDRQGDIAYEGAIDSLMHKDQDPVNYVDAAVTNLRNNEPVAIAYEKPYGCSVKFKTSS